MRTGKDLALQGYTEMILIGNEVRSMVTNVIGKNVLIQRNWIVSFIEMWLKASNDRRRPLSFRFMQGGDA